MDTNETMAKLEEVFGSRLGLLGQWILMLSMTGQPCDVTFFRKGPAIDVKIDQQVALALMYGAGARKLGQMLESIRLSNGNVISIREIWMIHPMPKGGFSKEELDAVDMSQAEEKLGADGETLRKMIRDTYHCKSRKDEDYYLRRFIAS